jgi:hypothetical protein
MGTGWSSPRGCVTGVQIRLNIRASPTNTVLIPNTVIDVWDIFSPFIFQVFSSLLAQASISILDVSMPRYRLIYPVGGCGLAYLRKAWSVFITNPFAGRVFK